ncbi:hypothetical protein BKA61DRAFT_484704 [Leptodontidium sp. MPI-SDFR-AT-0119]|nr:hypothetical protein BKA61DRAFT_484704 [Leptodontidium sp. MPI-SDFR-AT-0119]
MISSTEVHGARLLREIASEEGSLEDVIALLDLTGRFSPSHLLSSSSTTTSTTSNSPPPSLTKADLIHIHVFKPTKATLQATLDSIENYMLYGEHKSHAREWLGTIVNGGVGGDINLGWRGWLRVEREEVGGFGEGVSVEEAWGERERRGEVVDARGWRAEDEEGIGFVWRS